MVQPVDSPDRLPRAPLAVSVQSRHYPHLFAPRCFPTVASPAAHLGKLCWHWWVVIGWGCSRRAPLPRLKQLPSQAGAALRIPLKSSLADGTHSPLVSWGLLWRATCSWNLVSEHHSVKTGTSTCPVWEPHRSLFEPSEPYTRPSFKYIEPHSLIQ